MSAFRVANKLNKRRQSCRFLPVGCLPHICVLEMCWSLDTLLKAGVLLRCLRLPRPASVPVIPNGPPAAHRNASFSLAKTILFLAETRDSPSIDEQRAACGLGADLVVDAGQVSFADLPARLARSGHSLASGDTIRVYDLSCLPMNTMVLLRLLAKLLRKGISVELFALDLIIAPEGGALPIFIDALDSHWRRIHGIKTRSATGAAAGRKKVIDDDQLAAIRQRLDGGATVSAVARDLGVGRTTLFDFLRRHDTAAITV